MVNMEVYIILLVLVLFGLLLKENRIANCYYGLMVLILFLVSTFRAPNIGADYMRYIDIFYRIAYNGANYFHEAGFNALCRFVGAISDSYFLFAGSVNMLLFLPLFYYISINTSRLKEKFIALFIFLANPYLYLQTTTNMMRQCCATGIVLLAIMLFRMIKRNLTLKYILFVLTVLLATQFHRSALIVIVIIPLLLLKLNGKIWGGFAVFSLFLGIILTPSMIGFIGRMMGYGVNYTTYEASLLNNPLYIMIIFLYTIFICCSYDSLTKESSMTFFVDIYLFSLCMLLFAVKNDAIYRIRLYFLYISLPALPYIINQIALRKSFTIVRLGVFRFDTLILQLQYFYYMAFYLGYIGLLAYRNNSSYIPFKFGF